MRRKPLVALCLAIGTALVLTAVAAAGNGGFAPPEPQSPNADRINDAYYLIAAFAGLILLGVEGALLLFIFRFRRRNRPADAEGPQIRGNTRLELLWTIVPVLILAVTAAFVFYKIPGIENIPEARAGGERLEITVEGRQFYWRFVYPDGSTTIDELVVPANEVVVVNITAPDNDVLHSWWVPQLGGKFDAIPGQTNTTWFRARRTGRYVGRCGEFCGLQHAAMNASVLVVPRDEFEERRRQRQTDFGAEAYVGVCQKCHLPEIAYGPPLEGNPIVGDEETIRQTVTQGRGKMPAVSKGWTEEELDALTTYLKEEVGGGGQG